MSEGKYDTIIITLECENKLDWTELDGEHFGKNIKY